MAQYFINGTNITSLGVTPSVHLVRDIALRGAFDFPGRDGETEKDWGDSYEAFVDADDITWKEKEIVLRVLAEGSDMAGLVTTINAFSNACINATTLSTSYGLSYNVRLVNGVNVKTHVLSKKAICEAKFNVLNPLLSGTIGTGTGVNSGFCLDAFRFIDDLSLYVIERDGNNDVGKYNQADTTDQYDTPITVRQPKDITLKVMLKATSLSDMVTKMGKLHQIVASSGLKTLRFPDGSTHEVYVKDGFKLNQVQVTPIETQAYFYFKFREV